MRRAPHSIHSCMSCDVVVCEAHNSSHHSFVCLSRTISDLPDHRATSPTDNSCEGSLNSEGLFTQEDSEDDSSSHPPSHTHTSSNSTPLAAFTDGSSKKNGHSGVAGWGFVLVEGCEGFSSSMTPTGGHEILRAYGRVETDASKEQWNGATIGTNNTGELSAIIEAMHLYKTRLAEQYPSLCIFSDSQYAINVTNGTWKGGMNAALVKTAKDMYNSFENNSVKLTHVAAHSGHKWNDVADKLALEGGKLNLNSLNVFMPPMPVMLPPHSILPCPVSLPPCETSSSLERGQARS